MEHKIKFPALFEFPATRFQVTEDPSEDSSELRRTEVEIEQASRVNITYTVSGSGEHLKSTVNLD